MGEKGRSVRTVRGRRAAAVAALAAAAVCGVAACDPAGLNAAAVAYTTDETATAELHRRHLPVRWLACTAHDHATGTGAAAAPSSRTTIASVDCRGRTRDDREITVTGEVTRAVGGVCVRGDLTARVGGAVLFRTDGLGDCDAGTAPDYRPLGAAPAYRPPGAPTACRPPDDTGRPPASAVPVTRTAPCPGDPVRRHGEVA